MTTDNIGYGTSTAITCSLAPSGTGLASSSTVGRGSATQDNTTNKFIDALVTIKVKTGAGTIANDKGVYVFVWAMLGDTTTATASSAEGVGSDASITQDVPTNMKLALFISTTAASTSYTGGFSVASLFGSMPQKWGIFIRNYSGVSLDGTETNHTKVYSGITYTNA